MTIHCCNNCLRVNGVSFCSSSFLSVWRHRLEQDSLPWMSLFFHRRRNLFTGGFRSASFSTSLCSSEMSFLTKFFCLRSVRSTEDKGFKMRTYSTLHAVKIKHKRQYFNLMMIISLSSCSSLCPSLLTLFILLKGWSRWREDIKIESETNSMQSISWNVQKRIEGMLFHSTCLPH